MSVLLAILSALGWAVAALLAAVLLRRRRGSVPAEPKPSAADDCSLQERLQRFEFMVESAALTV